MSERDERIGPTAHYTAYVWHRLGLPYASLFATDQGRRLFWSLRVAGEWIVAASPTVPSMVQYLELRHRLIDHELAGLSPDHVVELGAGLSRRGVTWAADYGVPYTEVDLPHMVDAKRHALGRASAALRARFAPRLVQIDRDILAPGLPDFLAERLSGAAHPVVIAEGVMGYFPRHERAQIAGGIAQGLRAAGGGSFLCDLRAREGGARVAAAARFLKLGIRLVTRGRGAREDFADADEIRRFFAEAGFSSSEPVDPAFLPHLAHLRSPARVWHARVA